MWDLLPADVGLVDHGSGTCYATAGKKRCERCQRCVSTIYVCRKEIVDSVLKIMINRNLFFYYYTPYATQATAQRKNESRKFGGVGNND